MVETVGTKKGTTIELIRDILKSEMNLPDERIYYYNQDYVLPDDDGLWVIVSYQASKVYANRNSNYIDGKTGSFNEAQNVNTQEQITVHLMSFNLDALKRKEEVLQALASMYSQNLQSSCAFFLNSPRVLIGFGMGFLSLDGFFFEVNQEFQLL